MGYRASVGDKQITITPQANGHERRVTVDDRELRVDWQRIGDPSSGLQDEQATHYSAIVGSSSHEVFVRRIRGDASDDDGAIAFEVTIAGRPYLVQVQDERAQALASLVGDAHGAGDATIRAPMPGLVSNVMAAEGDAVERGQALVVLEAMKMENDLSTPRAGVVKQIRVSKGQTVNQGDVLAVVGSPAGEQDSADDESTG